MRCPKCASENTTVADSRPVNDGDVRRRRRCEACGFRFTTYERFIDDLLDVRLRIDGSVNASSVRQGSEVAAMLAELSAADFQMIRNLARRLSGRVEDASEAA